MNEVRYCLSVVMLFLVVFCGTVAYSQSTTPAPDGWQGPRPKLQTPRPAPRPQTPLGVPAPQGGYPQGNQVLEIPSHKQPALTAPARQEEVPPPSVQQPSRRPSQMLTVTVTDREGRYVANLRSEDFVVYEEALPQPLTYFNQGQDEPMSLGLVVDMSESMTNKLRQARQAVQRLADTIQAQDEVFLLAFSQQPVILQDFTDSRALMVQATTQLQPGGGTALYDAVLDGLQRMKTAHCQKKALVVITDGLDTASTSSLERVTAEVRRAGILVYTIGIGNASEGAQQRSRGMGTAMSRGPFIGGFGPGVFPGMSRGPMLPPRRYVVDNAVDSRLLASLSEETGAQTFLLSTTDVVGNGAVLEAAADTIVTELRHQYSLGYRSAFKGDVHRDVRVETRRPDLVVRTQSTPGGGHVAD